MQCITSAAVDNASKDPNGLSCAESPSEGFLTDGDSDSNLSQEEDDEYFIFAGRGLLMS